MTKINSNSKGRYKQRHSNSNANKLNNFPASKNTVFDSNGPCGKVRGNVSQVIEKYQAAAKDAMTHSEHVLAELCMQYADHYNRIAMNLTPEPSKKIQLNNNENNDKKDTNEEINNDFAIPDLAIIDAQENQKPEIENIMHLTIENV